MKRIVISTITAIITVLNIYPQDIMMDTVYYDSRWKGVQTPAMATYYRISIADSAASKQTRTYYMTGELQSESGYITIDKDDDTRSILNGPYTTYYRNGKAEEKGCRVNGLLQGEHTVYYENGLIMIHETYKDNLLDGTRTEFSEDGTESVQTEFRNGLPKYDYYTVTTQEGYKSKYRLADDTQIWESPSADELQYEYDNGEKWMFYVKNGVTVATIINKVRDYGKYYRARIVITNNTASPIIFDPEKITSDITGKEGETIPLKVYSAYEYMKKVKRRQNWAIALVGISEGLAAANAGHYTTTTFSNTNVYSSYRNNHGHRADRHSSYSTVTTTHSYDAAAAFQAQIIAGEHIAAMSISAKQERDAIRNGYLQMTTINPGESISGYIHIQRSKGKKLNLTMRIYEAGYTFPWIIR